MRKHWFLILGALVVAVSVFVLVSRQSGGGRALDESSVRAGERSGSNRLDATVGTIGADSQSGARTAGAVDAKTSSGGVGVQLKSPTSRAGAAASSGTEEERRNGMFTAEKSGVMPADTSTEGLRKWIKNASSPEEAETQISKMLAKRPDLVPLLRELIAGGDPDVAVLAARGLAASGTVEAFRELLGLVTELPDGVVKRAVIQAASAFASPAALSEMFEAATSSDNREVLAVAHAALANIADTNVLWSAVALYNSNKDQTVRNQTVDIVRHLQTGEVVPGLIEMVREAKGDFGDPMYLAAVDTLAAQGGQAAVNTLFKTLQGVPTGSDSAVLLSAAISRVTNQESLNVLRTVARGESAYSALPARIAAIQALANYSEAQVQSDLQFILQREQDQSLRGAVDLTLKRLQPSSGGDLTSSSQPPD